MSGATFIYFIQSLQSAPTAVITRFMGNWLRIIKESSSDQNKNCKLETPYVAGRRSPTLHY
jgi:hypothetical protein